MQVKFAMTLDVECVAPQTSLQEAARRMKLLDVGTLPVCADGDRLVGMLTDRDIVIRAIAERLDPGSTQVESIMSLDVIYCFEDQDIKDAATLMEEHRIRRLVVLSRDKRMVGLVSLGDLATRANPKQAADVLHDVAKP